MWSLPRLLIPHLPIRPRPDFVARLKKHLGLQHLLIGYDFALGKGRQGDAARLIEMGTELGYEVEVIPALADESGVISSTEIRKLVAIGNVAEAAISAGALLRLAWPGRPRR